MAVDKMALYKSTMELWPATVDLTTGPDATNKIYWANQAACHVDDDWRQVAMWAFHQALSELEQKASAEGVSIISPRAIEFDAFDKWMRSNLEHDDWSNERKEWEAGD